MLRRENVIQRGKTRTSVALVSILLRNRTPQARAGARSRRTRPPARLETKDPCGKNGWQARWMWLTAKSIPDPLAKTPARKVSCIPMCASRAPGGSVGRRIAPKAYLTEDTRKSHIHSTDCTTKSSPFLLSDRRTTRAMTSRVPSWRRRRGLRRQARRRNSWRPRRSRRRCTCWRRT